MATPTNTDIALMIKQNHEELVRRVGEVEVQTKLTNGRVKELERKEIGRQAVEEYKAKKTDKRQWDTTTIILLISALAAFVGSLWWIKH